MRDIDRLIEQLRAPAVEDRIAAARGLGNEGAAPPPATRSPTGSARPTTRAS
jgi:hypothetical protein